MRILRTLLDWTCLLLGAVPKEFHRPGIYKP
jgi:hypothetical protein